MTMTSIASISLRYQVSRFMLRCVSHRTLSQTSFKRILPSLQAHRITVLSSHHKTRQNPFNSSRLLCTNSNEQSFEVINIQDVNHFKEVVLDSKEPIIVDFHANWCGPCKLLAPRLEKVMATKSLKLAKVDIDNLSDLAVRYKVSAIPAVVAIKGGRSVDQFVGLIEEDQLETFISKLIDSK